MISPITRGYGVVCFLIQQFKALAIAVHCLMGFYFRKPPCIRHLVHLRTVCHSRLGQIWQFNCRASDWFPAQCALCTSATPSRQEKLSVRLTHMVGRMVQSNLKGPVLVPNFPNRVLRIHAAYTIIKAKESTVVQNGVKSRCD